MNGAAFKLDLGICCFVSPCLTILSYCVSIYLRVIRGFKDGETEKIFNEEFSKKLPPGIQARALAKLMQLNQARSLDDLAVTPGHGLEALKGDRKGQYSIRINKQWRICFRFEERDAYDVEITNYH